MGGGEGGGQPNTQNVDELHPLVFSVLFSVFRGGAGAEGRPTNTCLKFVNNWGRPVPLPRPWARGEVAPPVAAHQTSSLLHTPTPTTTRDTPCAFSNASVTRDVQPSHIIPPAFWGWENLHSCMCVCRQPLHKS